MVQDLLDEGVMNRKQLCHAEHNRNGGMASIRFKPITLAFAASVSLVLSGGTAWAEIKQSEQKLSQAQDSPHRESTLTAEQVQALESDIERLSAEGRYAEASKLQHRVLKWHEIHRGPEHPSTGISLDNLARLYQSQGLSEKAEPLYLRALAIDEKALGPEHPSTGISLNNLADLYQSQGLYEKAEPLYLRSLAISEKALGPEHPDTATSLNNLASLYEDQGLYAKAEPLYLRSLAISEKALGPEHPSTATILNNLALLYDNQGLYAKTEPLYLRSLAIREKALGPEHPDTAASLNNLAELYQSQGLYEKAEPLYLRALAIDEKALGPEHPSIATILNNLASLYKHQGLYAKAEPLYLRALAIKEKALGPEHPDTATSLNNLAEFYYTQGLYAKAEPLYLRSLAIREKALGPEHPATATSLHNFAGLYYTQGLYAKAEPLYLRALAIAEKVLGPEHPETGITLNNLAGLYHTQGLYAKAEPLFLRALAIREKALGPEHPSTGSSLGFLADTHLALNNTSAAFPLLRRAITAQVRFIQREVPAMARQQRQQLIDTLSDVHLTPFSLATDSSTGAELALFSRLNRQGLLQEIEQRQAQLASLPGAQQPLLSQLRSLTESLSDLQLSPAQRQQLQQQRDGLERQLYQLLPSLRPRVVDISQVAAKLPARSALLEFQRFSPYDPTKPLGQQIAPARYLALLLEPDRSITAIDLGPAQLLEANLRRALTASEQMGADADTLWASLSAQLLTPLAPALQGLDTLWISPDAELNRLPFAALTTPGTNTLLSDSLNLRLLTTGRELLDLAAPAGTSRNKALVVVNPAFDLSQAAAASSSSRSREPQLRSADLDQLRWAPLPGTQKEGEAIAQLTDAVLLSERQASAAAVQQSPAAPLLHIASHGFFLPDQSQSNPNNNSSTPRLDNPMLRSGIALAGANQASQRSPGSDDGYLTALEVAQLDWRGTELVVISACESGLGMHQAGEGVYGLKRAIAVSGARSSLLSLWKVDDTATAAFMQSFYQRLKNGDGRAEALTRTQAEFRSHPIPAWRHPSVWAAFQLSGDWRPIPNL